MKDSNLHSEDIASVLAIVISIVGITFNILNIVIATRKTAKGSLHIYLITLSIVDGLFLITIAPMRAFRCGSGCPPPTVSVSKGRIYHEVCV